RLNKRAAFGAQNISRARIVVGWTPAFFNSGDSAPGFLADARETTSQNKNNHQNTHQLARMAFTASRIQFGGLLNLNLRAIQITNALILTPVFADLNVYFDWYLFFK